MKICEYLMEDEQEILRLEKKTQELSLKNQAAWAGIREGMSVLDVGCGSGKTSHYLAEMVVPGGTVKGIDSSLKRIEFAKKNYENDRLLFEVNDIFKLQDSEKYDFIWLRFVLQFHKARAAEIVKKCHNLLKEGGILLAGDLDCNCLNLFGQNERLNLSISNLMSFLEQERDFDPFLGRKIYSYLYDSSFVDIKMNVEIHHLIFGELGDIQAFNWHKKVEVGAKNCGYSFPEYQGGHEEFAAEFKNFFWDPRRFAYTPLIIGRGVKK